MNTKNIEIFNDTRNFYEKNLKAATESSIARTDVYSALFPLDVDTFEHTTITVTKNSTIQAALKDKNGKLAIHNFASATNPGGGVLSGSSAQEECICRCTNLYPCLSESQRAKEYFYDFHREQKDNRYSNRCIYTPDVVIFKDANYNLLPVQKKVDVITCAAPNLRSNPNNIYNAGSSDKQLFLTDEQLYDIHSYRAAQILSVAIDNGDKSIILGAFGCGAFRNNPEIVAYAFNDAIKEYGKYFKNIEFAVYCTQDWTNFETFDRIITKS